ncbi:DUF1214 domain-containing protein [Stappia sp.]|uniref:DUF1214 domain-containing protein n=1 Tax=Stappia sp. TaxID=1870903 RepID=UPI0032D92645
MTLALDRNPETDGYRADPVPPILARPRRSLAATLAAVLTIALVSGLGSAYLAIERGATFDRLRLGAWEAHPVEGTPEADPYSAATHARTGRVPLASGEGLIFFATTDSAGAPLTPACEYLITGKAAPARLWTLTALDASLRLTETVNPRAGLHSRQILRRPDGTFEIRTAARARPGNWLPTAPDADGLVLALRLYDTPLTTGTGVANVPMPEIRRGRCR